MKSIKSLRKLWMMLMTASGTCVFANQHLRGSGERNGTQKAYMSRAKAMSNSEEIKPVALTVVLMFG